MELNEEARAFFKEKGRKGGLAKSSKHGKEHYKEMQKKSVESRKRNSRGVDKLVKEDLTRA